MKKRKSKIPKKHVQIKKPITKKDMGRTFKTTSLMRLQKELREKRFRVAIYGSARIKRNDSIYKDVYSLAKMMGESQIDVVTGGGPGLMEAANLGHKAGNIYRVAHSLGLQIKLPHEQSTNRGVDISKDFNIFSERLDTFVLLSNVMVVAPGGIGTLLELYYSWQLVQVHHICETQIILLGKMWPELIAWMKKWQLRRKFVNPEDFGFVHFAATPAEAMKIIRKQHKIFHSSGNEYCLNFERYKMKKAKWEKRIISLK